MTEFNLSDKISYTSYENCRLFIGHKFLMVEDVKEFIKRLKEVCSIYNTEGINDEIDKLAGDKLI